MKYFQRMSIEQFIKIIVTEDKEVAKITDSWNIERDEVISIIINHFKELGIFFVEPMGHAELIYENIVFQLKQSPVLIERRQKVNKEIERAKAKHARRHG